MKKLFPIFIGTVILVGFVYWFWISPPVENTQTVFFKIQSGESWYSAADRLEEQGLIRSSSLFLLYAKLLGVEDQLQPGRHRLQKGMTFKEVVHGLTNTQAQISVTIPEGFSIIEIGERLTEMGLTDAGEFKTEALGLEGYLFPDTYFVDDTTIARDLVNKMKANFLTKITPDFAEAVKKENRGVGDIIKMASILEKEVKTPKDMAMVSGILWKRLDNEWPLQADATLLYGRNVTSISQKDLESDNPYNTRNKKGLPPTPIGNPGMNAIRAAIYPEKSPYWFYLSDEEGQVHYAVTNEEHNENRRKYLTQ